MSPIQQMLLGVGAVATKTYVDDVFNTNVWAGTSGSLAINNGIDLGEGGLVWMKMRNTTYLHGLYDTVRGTTKELSSDSSASESTEANGITAFNSNGFTTGSRHNQVTQCNAWTFRKAPGFFDVVTYSNAGAGNTKTVNHSLGCSPGLIIIKSIDTAGEPWTIYHKDLGVGASSTLNFSTDAAYGPANRHFTAVPNSTSFTLTADNTATNAGGTAGDKDYVAYVFAGGESTAATARSVDFDGTGDRLTLAASNDFAFGTGDFTIECWAKPDSLGHGVFQISSSSGGLSSTLNCGVATGTDNQWRQISSGGSQHACGRVEVGQWYHIASVRSSGVTKLYINGIEVDSRTDTANYGYDNLVVGGYYSTSYLFDGHISNFRVVKGTAVYTSSFRPPTEPLTNITNTKLLCCNNSSTTGSTVTPGTITANGDPTASTDSPFDDPAGFVFGDAGDQNVIKCGSYVGNGNADGPDVFLGWEPQWLMVKRVDSADEWPIYDSMRGIVTGGNDSRLYANQNAAEYSTNANYFALTPTGFKVSKASGEVNASGGTYIYLCIRRPDGYVGKPPELGTGVFAMDTGGSSSTIPNYDSGFPVDFAIYKTVASSGHAWWVHSRLTEGKELQTNSTSGQSDWANGTFDSNTGWSKDGAAATVQSWMWKRHAGFDVVTYTGNGTAGHQIPHNLGKTPEMIWVKNRDAARNWRVYHKGLNGGTNPQNYYLALNSTAAEDTDTTQWNDTAPTSTVFTVGTSDDVNNNSLLAMLFASVDGISKVGSYTGNGSETGPSISVGFQPRFILLKVASQGGPWRVLDSVRGMSSGNDKSLSLNTTAAQITNFDWLDITSTGFDIKTTDGEANANNGNYIYYCHA